MIVHPVVALNVSVPLNTEAIRLTAVAGSIKEPAIVFKGSPLN